MINLKIDNYKDTSQMASWRKLKLGDHIDILTGYSFKSKLFNTEGDGKPLIRNRNINNQIPDIYTTESYDQSYVVLPGDILITMDGDFNIAKWTGVESLLNQRVLKINKYDNETIVKNYLLYSLEKHLDYIHRITSGTTVKHLKKSDIENLIIPIPPIKEQQKIAEILSTVDEQIEQTDQLIEKTKELKKGLMQQLLTKGIGHTEFKQSELGEIPDNWEVKRLSEVTSIINGGTPSKNNLDYWDDGDILWATPTDITKNKSKYISNTEQKITKKGLKESSASLLPIGSILMTSRATIGARSINKIPMTTNQGFKAFICGEEVYNEFLYYYVEILIPIFLAKAAGSTFLEISKKNTEEQLISLPSIEEQKQIASILSSVDEDIVGYEQEKSQYEELKKGLMQQLLTGKTRVKVD